ncbi:MAG: PIN domain-containing protein [Burkholderiaceae bacterium]
MPGGNRKPARRHQRLVARRHGVQIGTIDAVLIQLCRKHDLVLLSSDNDFRSAAKRIKFRIWSAQ